MNCRVFRKEIDGQDARLRLSAGAERHAAVCAACQTLRDESASLAQLLAEFEPLAAPANFDARLRARLRRAETQTATRRPVTGRIFVYATPAAAAACLALLLTAGLNSRRREESPALVTESPQYTAAIRDNREGAGSPAVNPPQSNRHAEMRRAARIAAMPRFAPLASSTTRAGVTKRQSESGTARGLASDDKSRKAAPTASNDFTLLGAAVVITDKRARSLTSVGDAESRSGSSGVTVTPISIQEAARLGTRGGLLVVEVEAGNAAALAGLRASDVIESVDGQAASPDGFSRALTSDGARPHTLGVLRAGRRIIVTVPAKAAVGGQKFAQPSNPPADSPTTTRRELEPR